MFYAFHCFMECSRIYILNKLFFQRKHKREHIGYIADTTYAITVNFATCSFAITLRTVARRVIH